jgi:hypothetical protein
VEFQVKLLEAGRETQRPERMEVENVFLKGRLFEKQLGMDWEVNLS